MCGVCTIVAFCKVFYDNLEEYIWLVLEKPFKEDSHEAKEKNLQYFMNRVIFVVGAFYFGLLYFKSLDKLKVFSLISLLIYISILILIVA